MDLRTLKLVWLPFRIAGALINFVITVVIGFVFVTFGLQTGMFPPNPLGLEGVLNFELLGYPSTYLGVIVLFGLLSLTGSRGSTPSSGGD